MVLTRGRPNKINASSDIGLHRKTDLPHRECRRFRTTLQEPEDEIFWESDENIPQQKRKTRSVVTIDGKKTSPSLLNNIAEEIIAIEGDTDTDDDIFIQRRTRSKIVIKNAKKETNCSEYILDVHGEMTDKSDQEIELGLRRSSRQRRGSKMSSWLLDNKKLRGYPNRPTIQSSENEEHRPSRKKKLYLADSSKIKTTSCSPPCTRRSLSESANQRKCSFMLSNRSSRSRRSHHQRTHRIPERYRDDTDNDGDEEDGNEFSFIDNGTKKSLINNRPHRPNKTISSSQRFRSCRLMERKQDSDEENDNYCKFQKSVCRRSKRIHSPELRRSSSTHEEDKESSSDSNIQNEEELNDSNDKNDDIHSDAEDKEEASSSDSNENEEVEKEISGKNYRNNSNQIKISQNAELLRLNLDNSKMIYDGSKRQRKPVSRLTYGTFTSNNRKAFTSDEEEEKQERRYSLRDKRKATTTDPYIKTGNHRHRNHSQFISSPARKPVFNKQRQRATHASSTSSSDEESQFEKRKIKSMSKARSQCLPMNLTTKEIADGVVRERTRIGSSLADIDPMSIDNSVTFGSIGGLAQHVKSLKEMIIFPMMYPEVFKKFNTTPPKGVLFHGQPGTGKTLVARVLANECSQQNKKVAFFMRKGADCLSKWVGESERQLRLLFDQAYQMRPSIIFFDEIDGLAPVRSSRQDQIHSSIVSTLLALMDGLDSRGEVIVIGATNRIDAIDPALRRPGRFDREFFFPLPPIKARKEILNIHTSNWRPPPSKRLLNTLAELTVSFCGADIKALCAEATLNALRSRYPQIYLSQKKLVIDVSKIKIKFVHFKQALSKIVPAGQRAKSSPGRKLSRELSPLLQPILFDILDHLKSIFPQGFSKNFTEMYLYRPRILVTGCKGQAHTTHLAPAILHSLEGIYSQKLDLPALFSLSAQSPEEACAQIFHEAQRNKPSILYIPLIDKWWETLNESIRVTFLSLLSELESTSPILILATSNSSHNKLNQEIQDLFSLYRKEIYVMANPKEEDRRAFFKPVFYTSIPYKKKVLKERRVLEELPVAPDPEPRKLSSEELQKIEMGEEASLRELRIFLRQICAKLGKNRMFYIFTKPVDVDEVSDYCDVITTPMDLETMMTKIDHHQYECAEDFLKDIDLICANALEYNPDRNPEDKLIRHRACTLRDTAYAYIKAEMDTDFEDKCQDVREVRKKRKLPIISCPDFIKVGISKENYATTGLSKGVQNNSSAKTLDSTKKRKRRRSCWARGFVTTKRKRSDQTAQEDETKKEEEVVVVSEDNNERELNESNIDSSGRVDDEIETDMNLLQQTAIADSSLVLCNGSISTEDSHDSMKITSAADLLYKKSLKDAIREENKISIPVNEEIIGSGVHWEEKKSKMDFDWSHLDAVYESCISTTDESTIEDLDYLYSVIRRTVKKHIASCDRSILLIDVEAEIRKFAQYRNKF